EMSRIWSRAELEDALERACATRGATVPARLLAVHLNARYVDEPADALAARVEQMAEIADATPVLVATGPCHGDDRLARAVGAELTIDHLLVDRPSSLREITAILAHCDAYLGSSFHGLVTACAFGRRGAAVVSPESVGAA